MNFKSILLGTAAGFMGISAAAAADLPGEAVPSAVDYVKVCDTFGAGFFYIPGTETCLDISGRVRFTARYRVNDGPDSFTWSADGRVDFDARTSTEYGQLRSFFRLASDDRAVVVDAAYIQLGYLSVGYMGSLYNGDVLYGIDDAGNGFGDQVGIQVLVDDLGGGFYVGAALEGRDSTTSTDFLEGSDFLPDVVLKAGLDGQPWGSVNAQFVYSDRLSAYTGADDAWAAKIFGEFNVMEGATVRASAAYYDNATPSDADESLNLGLAVKVALNEAADVYAGIRYDLEDGPDDVYANVGVDYALVDGLVATGELSYADENDVESFSVIGRLTREW